MVGETEFADWFKREGITENKQGYFVAEACLGNKFIQAILGQIEAQQQVQRAA